MSMYKESFLGRVAKSIGSNDAKNLQILLSFETSQFDFYEYIGSTSWKWKTRIGYEVMVSIIAEMEERMI